MNYENLNSLGEEKLGLKNRNFLQIKLIERLVELEILAKPNDWAQHSLYSKIVDEIIEDPEHKTIKDFALQEKYDEAESLLEPIFLTMIKGEEHKMAA